MKRYIAFFLALLLIFAPITYLFVLVSDLDQKLDDLRQNQLLDSEKTHSDLQLLRQELMQLIADSGDEYTIVAVLLDCQCASSEEPVPTEDTHYTQPTHPTHPTQTPTQEPTRSTTQPTQNPTQVTQPPTKPTQLPTKPVDYSDNYYGRLYIPDVDISVALYYGAQQEICDREDSANIFCMSVFDGFYIADHNTQEFGKLANVKVGTKGYIRLFDDTIVGIVCTEILNGKNTGNYIVDEDGNTNLDADYLMYTCQDTTRNILICLWEYDNH